MSGVEINEKCRSECFFKSMTTYLNVTHHGWATNEIFNSRCSTMAILAFLEPFGTPFKSKSFSELFKISLTSKCF